MDGKYRKKDLHEVLVFLLLLCFLLSSILLCLFITHFFLALSPCIKHLLFCKGEIEAVL